MRRKINILKFLKQRKHFLLVTIFFGLLVSGYFSSVFHQKMGNLFFGKVPALYNVTLAKFFFERAAYPPFGKAEPLSHYQLSRTYFIKGSLLDALDEIKKEVKTYPDNTRAYYVMGLTYGYMNEEEKAIEAFSRFIEANPTSWAARNDKAWLQFRIGDIDGALTTIKPVAHDTENAWVQNTYGALLMNKKRYAEAKESLLYAKQAADKMTKESWGVAYPGNDPRIYGTGLSAMRLSIESNLKLLENR